MSGRARVRRLGSFQVLWLSSTISALGDGMRLVALPLLAVSLSSSPLELSAVVAAGFAPWLIFGLPGGVLADRLPARTLMLVVDAGCGLAVLVVAALVAYDRATLVAIAVLAFALASARAIRQSAAHVMVPAVVPADGLARANQRLSLGLIGSQQLAAPPLASLLYGLAAAIPLFIDAASFGMSALLLASLSAPVLRTTTEVRDRPAGRLRTAAGTLREGLEVTWRWRLMRTMCLVFVLWNITFAATASTIALWARDILGVAPTGYGFLFLPAALGGLAGGLVASMASERLGEGTVLRLSIIGIAVCYIAMSAVSHPITASLLLAADSALATIWAVVAATLQQSRAPQAFLGRVSSVYRTFGNGVRPLGAVLGGASAALLGLRAPFAVGGVALALCGVLAWRGLSTVDDLPYEGSPN